VTADIKKRANFAKLANYANNPKKNARIIASDGVRLDTNRMITDSCNLQAGMNTRMKLPVGHISLNFSVQDAERLTNGLMAEIGAEYRRKMGITDTQFILVRHFDKKTNVIRGISFTDGSLSFSGSKIDHSLLSVFSFVVWFAWSDLSAGYHKDNH
jgi:hypothetical protein